MLLGIQRRLREENLLLWNPFFLRKPAVDLERVIGCISPDVSNSANVVEIGRANVVVISQVVRDQSTVAWLDSDMLEQLKGSKLVSS